MPCFIRYYQKLKERNGKGVSIAFDFPSDVIDEVDEQLERFFKVREHREVQEKLGQIFARSDPQELAQLEALIDSLIQKALRKRGMKIGDVEETYAAYSYA